MSSGDRLMRWRLEIMEMLFGVIVLPHDLFFIGYHHFFRRASKMRYLRKVICYSHKDYCISNMAVLNSTV